MYEKQREKLLARRQELDERVSRARETLLKEHDKDWEEQAQERENEEVLEALVREGEVELAQIKQALENITAGDYGTCEECGAKINPARLEIMPYAQLCIDCAEKHEKKGR